MTAGIEFKTENIINIGEGWENTCEPTVQPTLNKFALSHCCSLVS